MNQLALKEKIGVNYMLLELTGTLNSYTITELQEKLFEYIVDTNVVLDSSQIIQVDSFKNLFIIHSVTEVSDD